MSKTKSFIPLRLKEARLARCFSMTDLAKEIDITRQAISQFENGTTNPSADVSIGLSKSLQMPLNYFYSERRISNERITPLFFRKINSATKKVRLQAEIYEEWLADIFDYLSNYFQFPGQNLLENDIDFKELKDEDIEDITVALRNYWGLGLGPIRNLTLLLENNGIGIAQHHVITQLDSFSCCRKTRPHIVINTNNRTGVGMRFDLAHELGHLILHKFVSEEELEEKELHKKIQHQANKFASSFLMPAESIVRDFFSNSISALEHLKEKWLVGILAIALRLQDLELINENQVSYIFRCLPNRRSEPLDDKIVPEKPVLLSRAINMLIENDVVTKENLLQELLLDEADITYLSGIEKEFFNLPIENNVVELKFKRV